MTENIVRKAVCPKVDAYVVGWNAGYAGRASVPQLYPDDPTLHLCMYRGWYHAMSGQEPQPETVEQL